MPLSENQWVLTLSPRIYDANGVIAPEVRFADLARHVWFSETRRPLDGVPETPLLGIITLPPRVLAPADAIGDEAENGAEDEAPAPLPDRAVALLFNGILRDRTAQGGNVLTRATLALIRQQLPPGFTGTLTVYATACRLSPATLKHEGVQFRQTPYDLNGGPRDGIETLSAGGAGCARPLPDPRTGHRPGRCLCA